jgi:nicotinate-nucleotide adenylyltransferase
LTELRTKVAILGGAFDPITKGHTAIARFVLSTRMFDEVWLMPCFRHLYGKNMTSADHRVEMCTVATRADKKIKVCTYEITNSLNGETYHLIKQLLEADFAKQFDFSIIIGMDNANTFDKWFNYKELEQMIQFVVVPRNGVKQDLKVMWYMKPPHVYLVPDKPLVECSSTQVREQLKLYSVMAVLPESLESHLDPMVFDYIHLNNLYT